MTTLVVQHHVRDYDAWKPVFDDHEEGRSRHGATGHTVLRGQEDECAASVLRCSRTN